MKDEHLTTKDKKFIDGQRSLYTLLVDHPYFQDNVSKLRKKYEIPSKGFDNSQKAFEWESAVKTRKDKFWQEIEALIYKFAIPNVYGSEARFFAYDYILTPERVRYLLPFSESMSKEMKERIIEGVSRKKVGASIIRTGNDAEQHKYQFRAQCIYIEVSDFTTERDLLTAFRKIKKNEKKQSLFKLPRAQEKARFVWLLKQKKLTNQKIADAFNSEYQTNIPATKIPLYVKRYQEALSTIRPL